MNPGVQHRSLRQGPGQEGLRYRKQVEKSGLGSRTPGGPLMFLQQPHGGSLTSWDWSITSLKQAWLCAPRGEWDPWGWWPMIRPHLSALEEGSSSELHWQMSLSFYPRKEQRKEGRGNHVFRAWPRALSLYHNPQKTYSKWGYKWRDSLMIVCWRQVALQTNHIRISEDGR